MMSSMIDTAQKEIVRNELLKMCDMAGSEGASEQLLRAGLKKMGISLTPEEIKKQISYLEDKKLVTLERLDNERLNIHRVVAKITALGMDVLEGNAEAAGIAAE